MSRGWLIDTNIVSEWVKPRPDVGVVRWLDEVDEDRIFLSIVSLVEIRLGRTVAPGRRRARLDAWLSRGVLARFERRTAVDGEVADAWAVCWRERGGRPRPARWTLERRHLPGRDPSSRPQSRRF